jgi:hypothetical protein
MDENVVSVSRISAIEGGLYSYDGVRQWWENWLLPSPTYKIEVVEIRGLGDILLALPAPRRGQGERPSSL